MAFPFSVRKAWVVKSLTTSKTSTADLKPMELGLFDYDTHKAVTGFTSNPFVYFAYGSPNFGLQVSSHPKVASLLENNTQVSFKSEKIYGKELLPARVGKPNKISYPEVAYLGYDGLNECYSLDFKSGNSYGIYIKLYGSAIGTIYPKGIADTIFVDLAPKSTCPSNDCTDPDMCGTVIDELVTKINNSWVAPYIRAEKVISCCDPVAITKFFCREYSLTLCDEGNALSLARVQAQYPTQTIKIASKIGTSTTYSFVQDDLLAAPAAYSQTDLVIPNCTTCPVGYTLVAESKILFVTIDNAGTGTTPANWLTEVQTVIPTATVASRTNFINGTSYYTVSAPLAYVVPTVMPAETTIVDSGSNSPAKCTLNTPITTAWVAGKQTYRIKREMCLVLDNPDCTPTNYLADIQTAYATNSTIDQASIAIKEAGTCKSSYTLLQYSQCMEDGCDTIAIAAFENIDGFKNAGWDVCPCEGWTVSVTGCPVPPAATAVQDCRCGVKLIGGMLDLATNTCLFDPCDAVNYDHIRFEVSVMKLGKVGEAGGNQAHDTHISHNKSTGRVFLSGQEVIRDVIKSRYYRDNEHYFSPRMPMGYKFAVAEGLQYGVDVNKFYYALYINHDVHGRIVDQHMGIGEKTEIALYFEESDYGLMQQVAALYNQYANSQGVNLPIIAV